MHPPHPYRLDLASRSSLFLYAVTAVALPVSLLDVSKELGLSFSQAGALSLVGSFIQFGVLLGAIPLVAKIGKILPLKAGVWILGLGFAVFTLSGSFASALLIITIISLGQALIEAILSPLVEDLHPQDDGSKQVLLHSFWPLGVIFGTLVIGELLSRQIRWQIIFLGVGILLCLSTVIYPRSKRVKLPPSRADFSHAGDLFSRPLFWLMCIGMFLAGGAEGGFTFWTASYIQVEYAALPRAGGLGTACFAVGMATGRLLASRLTARFGLKRILEISMAMALLGGISFFSIHRLPVLYGLMIYMGFTIAPYWPGLQSYAVRRIQADPTMLMSFLSCFGLIGFSGANFLMGIVGDKAGLRASFGVAPALLTLLLLTMLLEGKCKNGTPLKPLKKSASAEDSI